MNSVAMAKMVERNQIIKIHALKNALKLSDDDYRKLIYINFYPATSSKHLTFVQGEVFIENLEKAAIERGVWDRCKGKDTYEEFGYREGMATPAQLRKIEAMWKSAVNIKNRERRKHALRKFLDRHFKVSDLRFLDTETTKKVIHALKHMNLRKSQNCLRDDHSLNKAIHDKSKAEI
jgi:hypothetical protein